MSRNLLGAATVAALLTLLTPAADAGWNPEKEKEEMAAVDQTLEAFKADHPKLDVYFKAAYGYAVFPTVGKAALVIGGSHGKGKVFEQGKLAGDASVSKASIGLQAGGESYSMLIFFQDKATMDRFKASKAELAASASVVAVDKGARAQAAWSDGIAVFTRNKGGLMASAAIGGQKFEFTPIKKD